jgi:hypothetical protein
MEYALRFPHPHTLGDDYRQMSNEAFTLTLRLVQKIGQVNLTHAIIERLAYLFR